VRYAGRAPLDGDDGAEHRHLSDQIWYRGQQRVADDALPAPQTWRGRGYAAPPGWSVDTYRKDRAVTNGRSSFGGERSGLGGPARAYVEVGQFPARANAERMRHELKSVGDAEVVTLKAGPTPSFGVRLGPFSRSTAADIANRVGALGITGGAIVHD